MKFRFILSLVILLVTGCGKEKTGEEQQQRRDLQIYCAESFLSEQLWDDFEYFSARYDCQVQVTLFQDAGEILEALTQQKDSLEVDVICSIPGAMIEEVLALAIVQKWEAENRKFLIDKYFFDREGYFVPYAFSYLCLVYDSKYIKEPPLNFGEIQDNRWAEKLIMPDPITTGIGRSLLHFSAARFGKNGFRYLWDGIQKNFQGIVPTYDQGYRRFLAEEGSLIPGVITQLRYHREHDQNERIRGIIMQEGTIRIAENAAILKSSSQPQLAKRFVEYLLEKNFQKRIWNEKYMFPVNREVIEELGQEDNIKMYEGKCKNVTQYQVRREEQDWQIKLKDTLKR